MAGQLFSDDETCHFDGFLAETRKDHRMHNVRKSAAVLAGGVLVVMAWSLWAKPGQTSSQQTVSANDQMISNYATRDAEAR
jgi:hypothetical protein